MEKFSLFSCIFQTLFLLNEALPISIKIADRRSVQIRANKLFCLLNFESGEWVWIFSGLNAVYNGGGWEKEL